jgi:phosphopantothenate synthetase
MKVGVAVGVRAAAVVHDRYSSSLGSMEVDTVLTADLVLVALHDRDLQQMLGQSDAKVGVALGVLSSSSAYTSVAVVVVAAALHHVTVRLSVWWQQLTGIS